MAEEMVSDLDFPDFYFSALCVLNNEEAVSPFSDDDYAEELHLQEALMGSVIISHAKKKDSSSVLMNEAPLQLQEAQTGSVTISHMQKSEASSVLIVEAPPGQNLKEAGASSSLSFCEICAEAKENDQMFGTERCVHSYCSGCIAKHVAAKIRDSITTVTCPGLNCKVLLELETCRVKLSKGVIDLWEEALCLELISSSERLYCPYKDCSGLMVADKGRESIREAECLFCHRLFCVQCNVPWHCGVECEAFRRLNEDERGREDLMVIEIAKQQKWSRCPNCKFYVERTEGCPHMTCRCGFQFCYGCEAEWSDNHGGCQRE